MIHICRKCGNHKHFQQSRRFSTVFNLMQPLKMVDTSGAPNQGTCHKVRIPVYKKRKTLDKTLNDHVRPPPFFLSQSPLYHFIFTIALRLSCMKRSISGITFGAYYAFCLLSHNGNMLNDLSKGIIFIVLTRQPLL